MTIIPWARSVADGASTEELQSRIEELKTALPSLAIAQAVKDQIALKLTALEAQVKAHPDNAAANVAPLRAIIEQIKAATTTN